jgi:hypothetical protein
MTYGHAGWIAAMPTEKPNDKAAFEQAVGDYLLARTVIAAERYTKNPTPDNRLEFVKQYARFAEASVFDNVKVNPSIDVALSLLAAEHK